MAATMSLYSPAELSFAQVPLAHPADPAAPLRVDGRTPLQFRDLVLETNVSRAQGALGSASVTLDDAAGAGGGDITLVLAAVRGDIESTSSSSSSSLDGAGGEGSGGGGKVIVTLECAPTALPALPADLPQHLAQLLTTLFSTAALPPALLAQLVVLPGARAWTLYLDVVVLSAGAGNAADAALLAARAALATTRLPATRTLGWDDSNSSSTTAAAAAAAAQGADGSMTVDEGFSGLVKGGKRGAHAVDFELVDGGERARRLPDWEDLPIGLTLNLINQLPHLDATVLEEAASSSQLLAGFTAAGAVCGLTQLGEGELEFARLLPLLTDAARYAEDLRRSVNAKLRDA